MAKVVYHSATGVTKRVAQRFGGVPLDQYTEGAFVLFVPSYGAPITGQFVPKPVKKFLQEHSEDLVAVVGLGNRTFGADFCRGAKLVAERYNVPLLRCVDLVPTSEDEKVITTFLEGTK